MDRSETPVGVNDTKDKTSELSDPINRVNIPEIHVYTNGNGSESQAHFTFDDQRQQNSSFSKSPKSRLKPSREDPSMMPLKTWSSSGGTNCDDNQNKQLDNSPSATPWDRILQCFSVFKGKKISSTDSQSKLQAPSELKKNMTESDFFLYELAELSEVLDYQDTKNIGKHLPPRAIGYPWELTFSTTSDGFSLHSLYRKMDSIDSPVLFVIEDIKGRVFGGILSCALRVSENFYGSGDTFVFRLRPNFEVFKWSGENFYFIQGQDDFISVGSDDGRFGLWLDDNLYKGRTEECSTFGSPPLVEEKDFKIKTVECWTVTTI